MSDTVNFLIKVKDENDNTPHFLEASYQKSIPENNKPNQILLKVTALDSDIGENGRITYSLIDADEDLRIDARGNIIAVKPLDHETKPVLRFKVLASDNGAEKRASTADVAIQVTDVNDEAPAFDKPTYEFDVLENLPENTTVNTVRATDRDSGDNGAVVYSMLPKLSPFRILSNGAIVTKEELDREVHDLYTMTVYAEDKGKPSLTGTATVLIRIGDQNDHKPRILYPRSGNSTVAISFDAKPGAPVLSILAEDEDSGPNKQLEYHLVSNPTNQMFKISKDTGEIILQRSLTAQDAGRHRLTVVVSDKSPSYQLASNSSFDVIIFAPNETETAGNDREREHVLVVIVLGVVTGLVTVAVVITIVVIRRADAQRRKYVQSRSKILPEVERLETEKASVEYVISNSVTDGSKVGQDGGDELSRDVTHDEGFADKSFNTSQGSGGTTDQSDWSKALRLHQDLLKLHGVDPGFLVQASTGDDVTSDGSCESTTCDSGRGGSEEENGSHGRASPVNKDGTLYNNLNNPPRPQRQPFGQRMNSIQRPAFSSFSSGRPQGHAMDLASPTQSDRSSNAPVKHVSFREDPRRDWPQPNPQQLRGPAMIPGVERWGSTFGVDLHKSDLRGQADLNLTLDQSFDTGDDGNSTTTSGSYTVDDLSPRAMSPRTMSPRAMSPRVMNARSFLPEQAVV
ncbi:unnamed protein product [Lymnaea stagnalis]|uniref:Cadherin domain-containing protein n=1 Tax=Lymnaea stagnalis TaxID=6523 RepID=A0AAV2GYY6_LYMST